MAILNSRLYAAVSDSSKGLKGMVVILSPFLIV